MEGLFCPLFTGEPHVKDSVLARWASVTGGHTRRISAVQRKDRVDKAIPDQYAPTVLAELLPNDDGSTVDYGERVVGVRILGRQPSRSIHLDGNQRFYEGYLQMVRSWVSPDGLKP
jgi:hypothetical protein